MRKQVNRRAAQFRMAPIESSGQPPDPQWATTSKTALWS